MPMLRLLAARNHGFEHSGAYHSAQRPLNMSDRLQPARTGFKLAPCTDASRKLSLVQSVKKKEAMGERYAWLWRRC